MKSLTEKVIFGPVQKFADTVSREATGQAYPGFFMDWPRRADLLAQFTVREFEYPRADLPDTVHFVGPASQGGGKDSNVAELPAWSAELDAGRPVVHVT